MFVDTTVTLQDTDKGLYKDLKSNYPCKPGTFCLVKGLYPGLWPPCSLVLITHDLFLWWDLKGSLSNQFIHEIIHMVCEGGFVLKACNMQQWSTYSATII